ncbi:AfsR/SARP family transcriptional regulator [Streptomyces clavuligerus]|uniref:Transcriptional regulator, SARP family n=1 Tax=Streptomyces clavuligerus TaxID=1901 RepID=E2Q1R4_STRCL|nr:transcriptional regulator [Streptomyces clavuligerus]EFG10690.1 transcriptional regulator, SARP family [Streptomyces clavuligerus]
MGVEGSARGLRFGLLGPVRVWQDGAARPSGTPQQRALLTALLLREGRTAGPAELISALWGEQPPARALAITRTYASRLRKVLGPGALVSEAGGYAIRVGRECVDLFEAQELALEAEKTRAAGDRERARALIGKSLGLWDGEPLAHVPGPYAENQRTRLEEWRLQLLETRLDLDLEAGAHAEAVSELTALTAAHPLRERLRELLMVALYRSGRQAEALAVYADTRRLLADELGVDPRPELSRLQERILRADAGLTRPGTAAPRFPVGAPVLVRPAQLPSGVPDFTGHEDRVRELADWLADPGHPAVAVCALAGVPGVGKSTLAVHVAHAARHRFPDGQLYIDLQRTEPRADRPGAVLGAFLHALGVPQSGIPEGREARAALYRSVLAGRRLLVLLDNARDAAQIRPLLPGTAGCAVLVTSRTRMVDLAGARLIDLDVMSPEEALQLFTRIVGAERADAEPEAALHTFAACGFLPLALRMAASRLAARRAWTVSDLAARLADESRRLGGLQAGELAVRAPFDRAYRGLGPGQARAFRLLALADGPEIPAAAAAAMLGLPLHTAEDLLEDLVDASLLASAAPGRYHYHDLVRLHARSCAERDETPGDRQEALARLLRFSLATTAPPVRDIRPAPVCALGHSGPPLP